MPRPHPAAAVHRALPALLVPLVIAGGLAASRGGAVERFWGLGVAVLVLVVGAVVVAIGVRDLLQDRRRRSRIAANVAFAASTRPNSPFAPPAGRRARG